MMEDPDFIFKKKKGESVSIKKSRVWNIAAEN